MHSSCLVLGHSSGCSILHFPSSVKWDHRGTSPGRALERLDVGVGVKCCVSHQAGGQRMAAMGLPSLSCPLSVLGPPQPLFSSLLMPFFWDVSVSSLGSPHNLGLTEMCLWGPLIRPQVPVLWDKVGA